MEVVVTYLNALIRLVRIVGLHLLYIRRCALAGWGRDVHLGVLTGADAGCSRIGCGLYPIVVARPFRRSVKHGTRIIGSGISRRRFGRRCCGRGLLGESRTDGSWTRILR